MKIAVIGGGLLGRLITLNLYEQNKNVTLFEKGPENGSTSCAYVGLGMISPWSELLNIPYDDDVTLNLGIKSVSKWKQLIRKLKIIEPYLDNGCLTLARQEEQNGLNQFVHEIETKTSHHHLQKLTSSQIHKYEEEISHHFNHGVFFPNEGCLNSKNIFNALSKYFNALKIPAYYNCGECLVEDNKVLIPILGHFYQTFDFVIDTRGLGAKINDKSLRGVRGETLLVHAPQVNINRLIRVLDSKFPLYILPRGQNNYSIGASCIESENFSAITVRSTLEFLSMARFVHEGFMEGNILESAVQCRPAYANNKLKIELKQNSLSINGLYRHGILCAPELADISVTLIFNNRPLAGSH